jgi:hypothetical protein
VPQISRGSAHVGGSIVSKYTPLAFTPMKYSWYLFLLGLGGGTVVEALRYKPEGRGIDSR